MGRRKRTKVRPTPLASDSRTDFGASGPITGFFVIGLMNRIRSDLFGEVATHSQKQV